MFQQIKFTRTVSAFLAHVVDCLTVVGGSSEIIDGVNTHSITIRCKYLGNSIYEDQNGERFKRDEDGDLVLLDLFNHDVEDEDHFIGNV